MRSGCAAGVETLQRWKCWRAERRSWKRPLLCCQRGGGEDLKVTDVHFPHSYTGDVGANITFAQVLDLSFGCSSELLYVDVNNNLYFTGTSNCAHAS